MNRICKAQTLWRWVAEEQEPGTVSLAPSYSITAREISGVHCHSSPWLGRNLTPHWLWFAAHHRFMCYFKDCQPAQCNAQHQGFWSASSGLSACRAGMAVHNRESGLMLGLPCTSAFVGQETLLPVICHLPIGFQPWKGCLWTTCVWTHALATMKIS